MLQHKSAKSEVICFG